MSASEKKLSYAEIVAYAVSHFHEGKMLEAFNLSCHALKNPNAGHLERVVFMLTMTSIKVTSFDSNIKNAILACLDYPYLDNAKFIALWLQVFEVDPYLKDLCALARKGDFKKEDWTSFELALNDTFFLEGLRSLTLMSTSFEMFLRSLRRVILLELYPEKILKTKNMPFLCALAEQCFFNEYVFFTSDEEKEVLKTLPKDDPIAVAILGCYESLHGHGINPKLSAVAGFKKMIKTQILEPMREFELMETLPSFGEIDNEVSKNVREMYEQNPYPRWKSVDMSAMEKSELDCNLLIAGCGTGKMATQIGFLFPDIKVLACDISKRSISYAMRKAEDYGNTSVSFEHRDIMNLHEVDKKFDFIDCSGVLHHMEDPIAGWKQLIGRLAPGGIMLISLYSKKARANIQDVRELIAKRGLSPTPDNIRLLRKEIIDDETHPLRRVVFNRDFYSLSEARDLVFHIQEKTYTIDELKRVMDDLGIEYIRLKHPDDYAMRLYKENFPDDLDMTNLDNWDKMEDIHPDTFLGMFKIICKMKGDDVVNEQAQAYALAAHPN